MAGRMGEVAGDRLYYCFTQKLFIYSYRKKLIIFTKNMDTLELKQLYSQLDKRRQCWGLSWHKLAAQAKVSSTLWGQMERGIEPSAEDLGKLRAWLDDWGDRWN